MERQVVVTAMTQADIAEIAELEKICFSTPWSEQALMAELSKPKALFLVARDSSGGFCGYIGLNYVLDEGYINNIAVMPSCRRQGVARQLIESLLQCCSALGLAFATLEVRRSNVAAINLYLSFSFAVVGVRRDFYVNPSEDGVIMTKYLNYKELLDED